MYAIYNTVHMADTCIEMATCIYVCIFDPVSITHITPGIVVSIYIYILVGTHTTCIYLVRADRIINETVRSPRPEISPGQYFVIIKMEPECIGKFLLQCRITYLYIKRVRILSQGLY